MTFLAQENILSEKIRRHYDDISVFYRKLWGDHIHHGYWKNDESPTQAQINLIEHLAQKAGLKGREAVLDVGCGVGGSSLWLAKNLSCSVLGVTISPVQVKTAAAQAQKENLAHLARFQVMDANNLGLPSESLDAVWVIECSEHLPDKARFIENAARILKPGGVLALCAWLRSDSTREQQTLVREICERMLCPDLGRRMDYEAWMKRSGLCVLTTENLTPCVAKTWDICIRLVNNWKMKTVLACLDKTTRRFAESFPMMRDAFATGAMEYGLFIAKKPV